jgi:hypothetical protein
MRDQLEQKVHELNGQIDRLVKEREEIAAWLGCLAEDAARACQEYHDEGRRTALLGQVHEAEIKCAQETVAGSFERAIRAVLARMEESDDSSSRAAALEQEVIDEL